MHTSMTLMSMYRRNTLNVANLPTLYISKHVYIMPMFSNNSLNDVPFFKHL